MASSVAQAHRVRLVAAYRDFINHKNLGGLTPSARQLPRRTLQGERCGVSPPSATLGRLPRLHKPKKPRRVDTLRSTISRRTLQGERCGVSPPSETRGRLPQLHQPKKPRRVDTLRSPISRRTCQGERCGASPPSETRGHLPRLHQPKKNSEG
jgi:hypothetical protein